MSNSDSTHFSEQLSYIKHFIPIYGLEDMILARFTYILPFSEQKQQKATGRTFLTEG
jgi:hypothetical protein